MLHTCLCMRVCVYVCMCLCVFTLTHVHIHRCCCCTHACVGMYVCMYVCICTADSIGDETPNSESLRSESRIGKFYRFSSCQVKSKETYKFFRFCFQISNFRNLEFRLLCTPLSFMCKSTYICIVASHRNVRTRVCVYV